MRCLTTGQSNLSIGETLGISRRTVQTHLERIYKKLGVNTRVQAVVKAQAQWWGGPDVGRQARARATHRKRRT